MIAIDREAEKISDTDWMDGEAGAQDVFLLPARWSLLAKNPRRDAIEIARDVDPKVDLTIDFLLADRGQQADASRDEYEILGQPARLAAVFEAAAIH